MWSVSSVPIKCLSIYLVSLTNNVYFSECAFCIISSIPRSFSPLEIIVNGVSFTIPFYQSLIGWRNTVDLCTLFPPTESNQILLSSSQVIMKLPTLRLAVMRITGPALTRRPWDLETGRTSHQSRYVSHGGHLLPTQMTQEFSCGPQRLSLCPIRV